MALIRKYQLKFLALSLIISVFLGSLISYFAMAQTPFYYPRYKTINTGLESSSAALDLTNVTAANRRYTLDTSRGWQLIAVYITFTTAVSRTITVSDVRTATSEVYDWSTTTGDTSTTIKITPNPTLDSILPETYDLRVQFSQTASACSATVRVIYALELR